MSSSVCVWVDSSSVTSRTSISMIEAGCGGWVGVDGCSLVAIMWDSLGILLSLCTFGLASVGSVVIRGIVVISSSSPSSFPLSTKGDQSPRMGSVIVAAVDLCTVVVAGGAWISAETVIIRSLCGMMGVMCWWAGGAVSAGGSVVFLCVPAMLTCGCCVVTLVACSDPTAVVVVLRSASFDMMTA